MATTERNSDRNETAKTQRQGTHTSTIAHRRGEKLFTNNINSLTHPRHSTTTIYLTKDKRISIYHPFLSGKGVPLSPPLPTFPNSHANKMQEQTPLSIHPHTHFPGVKPSHTHLPSSPAFLTAFPPPVR